MANFCPKCGKENKPDDKFCRNCGNNLAESVEVSKEVPQPEKAPAVTQVTSKPSKPLAIVIIGACFQLVFWGLLLYWIWYSYGCATGKYPGTGDQACQWFYSTFSGGGNGDGGNGDKNNKCIPTGCGSKWYSSCTKKCYLTHSDCDKTLTFEYGCGSGGFCRQCP